MRVTVSFPEEIVVLDANAVVPVVLAAAEAWVTEMEWLPRERPEPDNDAIPNASVPDETRRDDADVTTSDVAATVPEETIVSPVARLSTAKVTEPVVALLDVVPVATDGADDVAWVACQPDGVDRAAAAFSRALKSEEMPCQIETSEPIWLCWAWRLVIGCS